MRIQNNPIPVHRINAYRLQRRWLVGFRFMTLVIFSLICGSISAKVVADSASIMFDQSRSNLNLDLGNNRDELERMSTYLELYDADSAGIIVKSIRVEGGASPEGSVAINERLSHRRANTIFDYFKNRQLLTGLPTESKFIGRDWRGLYYLVASDFNVPYRREVLDMLNPTITTDTLTARQSDSMLASLKHLHSGVPYEYMYRNLFPRLRESKLYVEYEKPDPTVEPIPSIDTISVVTVEPIADVPETITEITFDQTACRPFYMGLKSNLLYDALAIPSIGAEFYLGRDWSIVGNWSYGWWDKNSAHKYWRAYGGDISVRKWFGSAAKNKPLTGHHLGLYTGVFTYDFEWGGVGYMGGRPGHSLWDRCLFTAGIEYGYSLPIARRLNLDFTIGVGYVTGKVVKYHPQNGWYVWDSTRRINTVLPTKLEISLVWLIGCDNYNRK